MKARLVTLLEWHARSVDPTVDTWHEGRFSNAGRIRVRSRRSRRRLRTTTCVISLGLCGRRPTSSRAWRRRPPGASGCLGRDQDDLRRLLADVVPDRARGTPSLEPAALSKPDQAWFRASRDGELVLPAHGRDQPVARDRSPAPAVVGGELALERVEFVNERR
jgi:hypothetical protein